MSRTAVRAAGFGLAAVLAGGCAATPQSAQTVACHGEPAGLLQDADAHPDDAEQPSIGAVGAVADQLVVGVVTGPVRTSWNSASGRPWCQRDDPGSAAVPMAVRDLELTVEQDLLNPSAPERALSVRLFGDGTATGPRTNSGLRWNQTAGAAAAGQRLLLALHTEDQVLQDGWRITVLRAVDNWHLSGARAVNIVASRSRPTADLIQQLLAERASR